MTGSMLPAAYTTRSARNIPIGSLSCVMHKAVYWLATMGLRFRQPQWQLGEIDRHPPHLILGQPRGHKTAAWRYARYFLYAARIAAARASSLAPAFTMREFL